jgi:sec-independent protein translocase protein TatA
MLSGSFSIWHWMIVLVIVMAVFGTRKLRNAGGDLGAAVKNFKTALREGELEAQQSAQPIFPRASMLDGAPAPASRSEHE